MPDPPLPSTPFPIHNQLTSPTPTSTPNVQEEYWKGRGKAWEQWAIDQGYAPGPNSKYARPKQQQQQAQAAQSVQGGEEDRWAPVDPTAVHLVAADKAVGGVGADEFGNYFDMAAYVQKAAELQAWAEVEGAVPSYAEAAAAKQQQGEDDVVDMPRRMQQGEEDAFDARVTYYKALADWQQSYWQSYAKSWVQWSQDKGYAPSSDKAAFAGEEEPHHDVQEARRLDAFDDRMDGYKAKADYYKALGEWEANYFAQYGEGWAKWAQEQGYAPSPESKIYQANQAAEVAAKDAAQDAVNRYGNAGNEWVDWAIRQGYMPAPQGQQQPQQPQQQQQQQRRLDAFDDRVDYWKAYGKGWEHWAVEQGYAPGPESKYAHPNQQQQQQQQQQQPMSGGEEADKAEAIRGDFYKAQGRNWAQWLRDRTFGEDDATLAPNMPREAYTGTPGFTGTDGPVKFISEKLGMNVEADGHVHGVHPVQVDKAQADVYKHETWVGRSASRAYNGVANGAEHVAKAATGVASRNADRAEDAFEAVTGMGADKLQIKLPVPMTPPVDTAVPATPAAAANAGVPATPAVSAAAPKHKNMRGVAH